MTPKLFSFTKPTKLLVCETDGFSLRGAVLTRSGNRTTVLHTARSRQADMAAAVIEVVSQLKASGWSGGPAVLLSPAVLSTLIALPVNPRKPRPMAQMQELVRWEVEPLLMQHTTRWTVGHLLIGKGYMTEEQANIVMETQQGRHSPSGELELADHYSLRRFGDLALELGYIQKDQLQACLAGQECLKPEGEAIECGWLPQGEIPDAPGEFNWLISAVNQSVMQRWTKAYADQGVKLQAMYPITGCSAALLSQNATAQVLVESHLDAAFVGQFSDGKWTASQAYLNPAKSAFEACLEAYHALNPPKVIPVMLADWREDSEVLAEELVQSLDVDLKVLAPDPANNEVSPGMLGVAKTILFGPKRISGVRVGGPLPPLGQRIEVRAAALFLVLALSIGGAESGLHLKRQWVEADKNRLETQWKTLDGTVRRLQAKVKEVEKKKTVLEKLRTDQQRLEARRVFFGEEAPARSALVKAILGVLQTTVGPELIIKRIDELGKRVPVMPPRHIQADTRIEVENFNVEAWALSESAAQNFIQKMKGALAHWQIEVRDSQVIARRGPFDLDGYAVAMRLVKLDPSDSEQQTVANR